MLRSEWRRSSLCQWDRPQCVELHASLEAVRDSKTGGVLTLNVARLVRLARESDARG